MTQPPCIAFIGRRDLPLEQAHAIAGAVRFYMAQGYNISTGGAQGADQAAARAARDVDASRLEIYLPWASYERAHVPQGANVYLASQASSQHLRLAMDCHPVWHSLPQTVHPLMVRNAMIVLRFNTPVSAVCAAPNLSRRGLGGTGHAMRIAEQLQIPVWVCPSTRDGVWSRWK